MLTCSTAASGASDVELQRSAMASTLPVARGCSTPSRSDRACTNETPSTRGPARADSLKARLSSACSAYSSQAASPSTAPANVRGGGVPGAPPISNAVTRSPSSRTSSRCRFCRPRT